MWVDVNKAEARAVLVALEWCDRSVGLGKGQKAVQSKLRELYPNIPRIFKHKCGTGIQGKKVTHPIHDGPFPLSGFGRVHTETIPFCPQCEIEPNSSGAPIDVPFPDIAVKT